MKMKNLYANFSGYSWPIVILKASDMAIIDIYLSSIISFLSIPLDNFLSKIFLFLSLSI